MTPAAEDGEPWVLLHGWMGCAADWDAVARGLPRALTWELPGHGDSVETEIPDVAGTARLALRWLDELGVARCRLAGYSLGGRVALELTCQAPERVSALAMVSSTAGLEAVSKGGPDTRALVAAGRAAADRQRAAAMVRDFEAFLERWYGASLWGELKAHPSYPAMLARRRAGDPERLAASLRACSPARWEPRWDDLPRLAMPAAWIYGARDAKYAALAERGALSMRAGRLVGVPGCTHALLVEAPEAVRDVLLQLEADASAKAG